LQDKAVLVSNSPEADPLEFARAHRRRQLRLALVIGILVGVPAAWLIVTELQVATAKRAARLDPAQKAQLAALLDQREAVAKDRIAKWNAAIQPDALAALTPGTAECPLVLVPPTQVSAAMYVKHATHDPAFGAWQLCILRSAPDAPPCARSYVVAPNLATLRTRLAGDDVYSWDLEETKAAPPDVELPAILVLPTTEVRPEAHSGAVGRVSFTPGTLVGRSFLFDPAQGRFICGGDVSVRNSKTVDIEFSTFGEAAAAQKSTAEYETRAALERDLEVHLRFAAPKAMRLLSAQ
jgi:hypothetical protein